MKKNFSFRILRFVLTKECVLFFIYDFHALLLLSKLFSCNSATFCVFFVDWGSAETIYSLNLKPVENTVCFFRDINCL